MLPVSMIRCTNESPNKLHLKSTIKYTWSVEIDQMTEHILLISTPRLLC